MRALALATVLFSVGCGEVAVGIGNEGAACFENGTCNSPLVCLSDLCVRLSGDGGVLDAAPALPDADPNTPDGAISGACDPYNDRCAAGYKCGFDPVQGLVCMAAGSTATGEFCAMIGECERGTACIEGTCAPFCQSNDSCGSDSSCIALSTQAGEAFGVCLPPCDGFPSCAAGQCRLINSYPLGAGFAAICLTSTGTVAGGDPCQFIGECVGGFTCVPDEGGNPQCHELCLASDPCDCQLVVSTTNGQGGYCRLGT